MNYQFSNGGDTVSAGQFQLLRRRLLGTTQLLNRQETTNRLRPDPRPALSRSYPLFGLQPVLVNLDHWSRSSDTRISIPDRRMEK